MAIAHEASERAAALLRQRFPEVASVIDGVRPLATELSRGTPETTLVCNGIHLTSSVDRRAEAALQAAEVPSDAASATVYGVALGDLPRALLARSALSELTAVVLNPALVWPANACDPWSWLGDPRVRLLLAREQTRVARPFAVAPACLRLAEDRALRLRDLIQIELTSRFQQQNLAALAEALAAATPEIEARLLADGDAGSLYGSHAQSRCAVVAGGPSLERALPYLKRVRGEVRLVAVTTALRQLSQAGLVPDFAVAVDRRPELGARFDGFDLGALVAVPLVYLAGVHPQVLDRWPGPRLAAFRAGGSDRQDYPRAAKAELFCSGTVTHAAVDLAVQLGAREVTLIGADFCFADGKTHAGEAPLAQGLASMGPTALNGHGVRVPSSLALLGYLRDLEAYVARRPHVRFAKWGREGAELTGATWLD